MPGSKNRARLVQLIKLFHTETDEEHFLSLKEIQQRLEDQLRESVNTRTILDDLEFMRKTRHVFEITESHGEKKYSMPRSEFELHQLRILVDAVASARSITKKETMALIDKIKGLTSQHMGKKLNNHLFLDDRMKAVNERLKYYITDIHQAIDEQTKITFQYAKYTPAKERTLVHDGQVYTVAPYGLIWSNDYYYLIGEHEEEGMIKPFRLDRLENVSLTKERFRKPDFSLRDYHNEKFYLYSGSEPSEFVEVEFDNQLVNVVIDRFGTDIPIHPCGGETFRIRVKATVNDGLVRWLLTWGGDARVLSPQRLVEQMKHEAQKMLNRYSL